LIFAMSCLDEQTLDLRQASELHKALESHHWQLEHFDRFGEDGIVARNKCTTCGKEWTTLLINPARLVRQKI
jgi:hypothetical protein